MKKFIIFFAIVFMLSGCSLGSNSKYFEKVAGTYKVVSIRGRDKVYTAEEIKKIKNDYKLHLHEGGYAELYLGSDVYYLIYDKKFFITTNDKREQKTVSYSHKNNKIIVNYNDTIYTFIKDNK